MSARRAPMSFWSVSALGVGAIVGAGIFALLGEAAQRAGRDTWFAFLLGGATVMLCGYSYARLSRRYPSSGGIDEFYARAFGPGVITGTLSTLYFLTIMISSAMIAKSFGAYASRIFGVEHVAGGPEVFAVGILLALAFVNARGSRSIGVVETVIVAVKLAILFVLIAVGIVVAKSSGTGQHASVGASALIQSVGLIFFAYAGFGEMANAAGSVADPGRTIPRAIYFTIAAVTGLYILLSIVVLSSVTPELLVRYKDTAVAQAAEPLLGHGGFVLVAFAALLATASAINANFFSGLTISKSVSSHRELPRAFRREVWGRATPGFLGIVVLCVVLAVSLELAAVANIGSAMFLLSYLGVQVAHWKRVRETGASRVLIALGFLVLLVVLGFFLYHLARTSRISLVVIAGAIAAAAAFVGYETGGLHRGAAPPRGATGMPAR